MHSDNIFSASLWALRDRECGVEVEQGELFRDVSFHVAAASAWQANAALVALVMSVLLTGKQV